MTRILLCVAILALFAATELHAQPSERERRVLNDKKQVEAAGFWRRLGAIGYDLLLVGAVLLLATASLIALTGAPIPSGTWYHQVLLALAAFGYYGVAWTHGGQTLGMRTWRIRVRTFDGRGLSWRRAALRFAKSFATSPIRSPSVAATSCPYTRTRPPDLSPRSTA